MNPKTDPETARENTEEVRHFFEQWALYRKVAENNYLHHREAYGAIGKALKERRPGFSFLELGCGDAFYSTEILAGLRLTYYEAVDLFGNALELARENIQKLNCSKKLAQGDFVSHLRELKEPFDVILIGLSLHHLPRPDKALFFREVRRALNPGGSFAFYEPIMKEGETRDQVMTRFVDYTISWTALSPEEIQSIHRHVFENDYPETVEDFSTMAKAAGFDSIRVLFQDRQKLYAVFECC